MIAIAVEGIEEADARCGVATLVHRARIHVVAIRVRGADAAHRAAGAQVARGSGHAARGDRRVDAVRGDARVVRAVDVIVAIDRAGATVECVGRLDILRRGIRRSVATDWHVVSDGIQRRGVERTVARTRHVAHGAVVCQGVHRTVVTAKRTRATCDREDESEDEIASALHNVPANPRPTVPGATTGWIIHEVSWSRDRSAGSR